MIAQTHSGTLLAFLPSPMNVKIKIHLHSVSFTLTHFLSLHLQYTPVITAGKRGRYRPKLLFTPVPGLPGSGHFPGMFGMTRRLDMSGIWVECKYTGPQRPHFHLGLLISIRLAVERACRVNKTLYNYSPGLPGKWAFLRHVYRTTRRLGNMLGIWVECK